MRKFHCQNLFVIPTIILLLLNLYLPNVSPAKQFKLKITHAEILHDIELGDFPEKVRERNLNKTVGEMKRTPILHLHLDLGPVCLFQEAWDGRVFWTDDDPECQGLICAETPRGPILIWTAEQVYHSIATCLSQVELDDEDMDSVPKWSQEKFLQKFDFTGVDFPQSIERSRPGEELRPLLPIKVQDEFGHLRKILTDEKELQMEIEDKKILHNKVLVATFTVRFPIGKPRQISACIVPFQLKHAILAELSQHGDGLYPECIKA